VGRLPLGDALEASGDLIGTAEEYADHGGVSRITATRLPQG
jgi:hypothetical protein